MTSHTQSPLIAGEWEGSVIGVHRHDGMHAAVWTKDLMRLVAICGMADDAESVANAELFAAAPDLLSALDSIATFPCNCAPHGLPGDECESCIARAAINKAKAGAK